MIAVLTKYEALVDRVKDEYNGSQVAKSDILNYVKKNVLNPLQNVTYPPLAIVQTHRKSLVGGYYYNNNNINNILDKGKGCELLVKKTFEAIKDITLVTNFAMAQQNSIKLACQMTFKQDLYVYLTNLLLYLFICF